MKRTVKGSLFIIELNDLDSSFISQFVYDGKTEVLSVLLKNKNVYNYEKVPLEIFIEFSSSNSFGSFYNTNIKNKFKHLNLTNMANDNSNKPNKINKASKEKRYIKMKIDLMKLNKNWFYIAKDKETGDTKAIYADITLCMLPDGEVDKYGQLGFIVQEVPAEVIKKARETASPKPQGEILGNGEELEWKREEEKGELVTEPDELDALDDQLPF